MAEHLLNHIGGGRFAAFSAGNAPTAVNPLAIEVLTEMGVHAEHAVSKPVVFFEAEQFDFVINICDSSSASCEGRRDGCPVLQGQESKGCWGFESSAVLSCDREATLLHLRKVRDQMTSRLRIWMPAVDKKTRVGKTEAA
ncbi:MAG: hypothetical protein AUJ57_07120 [Zetaproteobacteria bacterium CG1_02_53_45]|nr:MAG: hypothetical protein AUJ57_07120 [Zetaproteobacteria bacterium CG1_02_53_45]